MRLSTKGRYGLRAMVDLAICFKKGQVTLSSIAQGQDISESYLEQLLNTMKKAGLVRSTRGHKGGYILARDPGEITVAQVLDVLEGTLAPVHCIDDNPPTECKRFDYCAIKFIWKKMKDGIYDVINSITLKDIADEQEKLNMLVCEKNNLGPVIKDEFGVIVIKNAKKEINNIAFNGKWLMQKEHTDAGEQGISYSVALTEKGKFFVLCENSELPEKNEYTVYSSFDELKANNLIPQDIADMVNVLSGKEESINFLDI